MTMVAKPRKSLSEMAEAGEPLGLKCRECGCCDLRVYYTRGTKDGRVRRVRKCRHCGTEKTTFEADAFH